MQGLINPVCFNRHVLLWRLTTLARRWFDFAYFDLPITSDSLQILIAGLVHPVRGAVSNGCDHEFHFLTEAFLAAGLAVVLVAVFLTVFVVALVAVLVVILVTGLEAVFLVAAAFFAGLVFLTGEDLLVGVANLVLTFLKYKK